ncbi:DUF2721 domain-containing protein [Thalassotalea sediminis]|uniref:DUF2721 domain-containing protein n=1 Tax=Thalassotalea sediminis TaxID=1759089 RepID=UPI0025747BCF|nr:DUF2721 domain-containing protein [Thalassotalea sediminis]
MNNQILDIITIGGVIQSAVAPVFLITGVASLLGVLSNRLARAMERARNLEFAIPNTEDSSLKKAQFNELDYLWTRISVLNKSYTLCSLCALLLCFVIVLLFVSHIFAINLSTSIAMVFIAAMLSLIIGLIMSLREVFIATKALRARFKERNIDKEMILKE